MNIFNISQTIVSKLRDESSATINNDNTGERRIHADRRREKRFGDTVDRRRSIQHRSD